MSREPYDSDVTDVEWLLLEPLIPPEKHGGRHRTVDIREVLNAIFYVLRTGCAEAIAATANVVPRLVVEIYERFQASDLAGAQQAQERLSPLRHAFGWGTFPVVVKEAANVIGLAAGPAGGPVGPMSEEAHEKLVQVLRNLGLL